LKGRDATPTTSFTVPLTIMARGFSSHRGGQGGGPQAIGPHGGGGAQGAGAQTGAGAHTGGAHICGAHTGGPHIGARGGQTGPPAKTCATDRLINTVATKIASIIRFCMKTLLQQPCRKDHYIFKGNCSYCSATYQTCPGLSTVKERGVFPFSSHSGPRMALRP
jgi:hypothetical protein